MVNRQDFLVIAMHYICDVIQCNGTHPNAESTIY